MASIPLPALTSAQQVSQAPTFLEQAQRVAELRNLGTQNQLQQSELQNQAITRQQQQIQTQQMQLALKNMQIGQSVFQDPDFQKDYSNWQSKKQQAGTPTGEPSQVDYDPTSTQQPNMGGIQLHPLAQFLAEEKGLPLFGPNGALDISNQLIGSTQKLTELAKTQGDVFSTRQKTYDDQLDHFNNLAEPVISEKDPEKQDAALGNLRAEIAKNPDLYPPEIVQGVSKLTSPDVLTNAFNNSKLHQLVMDDATKIAGVQKAQAEATAAQQKLPGGVQENPEDRYLRIQTTLNQKQPVSPADQAFVAGYEKNKELSKIFETNYNPYIPGSGVTTTGPNGTPIPGAPPAGPATIDQVPGAIRAQVQAVVDRREPMPPMSKQNPVNGGVNYWVNRIDPQYDSREFPQQNKLMTELIDSAAKGPIGAMNTALGHLNDMYSAIDALNNGNVKILNGIANKYDEQVGKTPQATFQTIVHRLGPEIASAYVQGGGGETEREGIAKDFSVNNSPAQLRSNADITAKMFLSKIGSQVQDYTATMHKTPQDFYSRFLTPNARATLNRLAPQGNNNQGAGNTQNNLPAIPKGYTRIKASDGSQHDIPTANLDKAKKIDPNLQTVGSN